MQKPVANSAGSSSAASTIKTKVLASETSTSPDNTQIDPFREGHLNDVVALLDELTAQLRLLQHQSLTLERWGECKHIIETR